jgi:hypothetical protein
MRPSTGLGLAALALLACCASSAAALEPLPVLAGRPLSGPTHLRLIIARLPPAILDVDRGTVTPVNHVVSATRSVLWVLPTAGGAVAQVQCVPCHRATRAFLVRANGRIRPLTPDSALVRRANAPPRYRIGMTTNERLRIVDRVGDNDRVVRWPSTLGGAGKAVAQPGGRYVALQFGDPAYPGPQQAEDLFLYDTRTKKLLHVPGFPAQVDLKFSDFAWAGDGRLIMLLQAAGSTRLGVYRPGDAAVSLRHEDLPPSRSGSPSFVPLVQLG